MTFTDNGDGTATLAGTPSAGSPRVCDPTLHECTAAQPSAAGVYTFTITASDGVDPDATQAFTLDVDQAPAITSSDTTSFTVGQQNSFTVTTTGFPTPTLSGSGDLPSWLSVSENGDGTATISGDPPAGSSGIYTGTITASNGVASDAVQNFTLDVVQPVTTVTVDVGGYQTYGSSIPTLTYTDEAPPGVTLSGNLTCTTAGGDALAGLDAGSFTLDPETCSGLTVSGPGDNVISYTGVTDGFTVDPAQLTVTASSLAMNYGGAVPAIAAEYAGFVNGDTALSLATAPTCSTLASSSSHVGDYASSCAGAVDPNYAMSYVDGTVAVDPASQSVRFTSSLPSSATVGGPTYTPTASATSGLEPTITVDTSSAAVCSIGADGAVSFLSVGNCVLDANQAGDTDYLSAAPAQQVVPVVLTPQAVAFTSSAPSTATVGGATYTPTASGGGSGNSVVLTVDPGSARCAPCRRVQSPLRRRGLHRRRQSGREWQVCRGTAGPAEFRGIPGPDDHLHLGRPDRSGGRRRAVHTDGQRRRVGQLRRVHRRLHKCWRVCDDEWRCCLRRRGHLHYRREPDGQRDYAAAPQVQQSVGVGQGLQAITFTTEAPSGATVHGPTYRLRPPEAHQGTRLFSVWTR